MVELITEVVTVPKFFIRDSEGNEEFICNGTEERASEESQEFESREAALESIGYHAVTEEEVRAARPELMSVEKIIGKLPGDLPDSTAIVVVYRRERGLAVAIDGEFSETLVSLGSERFREMAARIVEGIQGSFNHLLERIGEEARRLFVVAKKYPNNEATFYLGEDNESMSAWVLDQANAMKFTRAQADAKVLSVEREHAIRRAEGKASGHSVEVIAVKTASAQSATGA